MAFLFSGCAFVYTLRTFLFRCVFAPFLASVLPLELSSALLLLFFVVVAGR